MKTSLNTNKNEELVAVGIHENFCNNCSVTIGTSVIFVIIILR